MECEQMRFIFPHSHSCLIHFFHWCCSAWILLVKKVINSRYDVIIWTYPIYIYIYIYIYIMQTHTYTHKTYIYTCAQKHIHSTHSYKYRSKSSKPERMAISEHFCYSNTVIQIYHTLTYINTHCRYTQYTHIKYIYLYLYAHTKLEKNFRFLS